MTERVLQVVGAMDVGGAESMLMNVHREMDRNRMQFDYLEMVNHRSAYSDEIEAMGGRIIKIDWASALNIPQRIRLIRDSIQECGPYLAVHSHISFSSSLAMRAAKSESVPIRITHSHSASREGYRRLDGVFQMAARKVIIRDSTVLAACSRDAGSYLFGADRFERAGRIIPNSVDLERFSRRPGAAELGRIRSDLGIENDVLVLACIARLEPVKNHRFLLRVAAELDRRGHRFAVLIAGVGTEGEVLANIVEKEGLEHCVRFLGLVKDVERLLHVADFVLLPSHFEGLPLAVVEAQAAGTRALVSRSVSHEADLGLRLVDFLPLEIDAWISAITETQRPRIEPAAVVRSMRDRGYSADQAVRLFLELYRVPS